MEKLIELLNEYDTGWDYESYYGPYQCGQDRDAYHYGKFYLISKEYGFIKRLVDNDKIDFEKLDTVRFESLVDNTLDSYLALLMVLAIQDEPIKFLCEIIK